MVELLGLIRVLIKEKFVNVIIGTHDSIDNHAGAYQEKIRV